VDLVPSWRTVLGRVVHPILVMHLTCLGHCHVYPMLPTLNQTKLYSGLHFVKRDKINIYAKM
jgi:hypothetical protein